MSDAPETIWVEVAIIGAEDGSHGSTAWATHDPDAPDIEYRRADLPPTREQIMADPRVMALVDALGRIKKRDGCGSSYITCHDCYDSSHEANATLAALTDNEGEME